MAGRRPRDTKNSTEWWRSWLLVIGACSAFAFASLQPSITVTEGHDGELVSAIGPDFDLPQDQAAALDWLADAGLHLDTVEGGGFWGEFRPDAGFTPSRFSDMVERALAEMNSRMPTGTIPTVPTTGPTTTTTQRPTTTTIQPDTTTTTQRPTTTTIQPDTTTTTQRPTTTTIQPATTTTTQRPTTTTIQPDTTTTTQRPTTTTTSPQSPTAEAEQRFVDLINDERAARGLPELVVNSDIRAVARNWTATMISEADSCSTDDLGHNPNYEEEIPGGWDSAAENVGCGGAVETLHRAFMNSSGHRANILGAEFTDVGVGVAMAADGTMWVTQNFAQY